MLNWVVCCTINEVWKDTLDGKWLHRICLEVGLKLLAHHWSSLYTTQTEDPNPFNHVDIWRSLSQVQFGTGNHSQNNGFGWGNWSWSIPLSCATALYCCRLPVGIGSPFLSNIASIKSFFLIPAFFWKCEKWTDCWKGNDSWQSIMFSYGHFSTLQPQQWIQCNTMVSLI